MIRKVSRFLSVVVLFIGFSGLAVTETTYAKTTSDPNHKGWSGKHPKLKQVTWKNIKVKCENCTQMAEQYNTVVAQLLQSRYWVKFWRSVQENRRKGKKDPFWLDEEDITNLEGKAVDANLELMELHNAQLELHRQLVLTLEQQASYLRSAIIQCELTACGKAKKPKIKDVKIGGDSIKQSWQPNITDILTQHGVDWRGPYSTKCQPCQPIVVQLNAVPGWIVRAHMKLHLSEQKLRYAKMVTKSNDVIVDSSSYDHPDKTDYSNLQKQVETYKAEIKALSDLFKDLLKDLSTCEAKYCASMSKNEVSLNDDPETLISLGVPDICNSPAAHEPITVGANNEVGSRANFKEKAKKKVVGAAVGAVGKLIGLGGGSKGKSEGPPTYKDPVKKKYKARVRDKKAKRDFLAGGVFTSDGLLISSSIKKSRGKGTFHTIYLENPSGWRLTPIGFYLYEIWRDWKLNVSWTRDTYVNGEHVKHEEGGWTESWSELVARGEETVYGEVPIWEQLGFTTAVSGARSLGTLFPVSPEMLASGPWNLVVHVSEPKKDPVTTVPYVFELGLDSKGRVTTTETASTLAHDKTDCDLVLATAETPSTVSVEEEPSNDKLDWSLRAGTEKEINWTLIDEALVQEQHQTVSRDSVDELFKSLTELATEPHYFVQHETDESQMLSLVQLNEQGSILSAFSVLQTDSSAPTEAVEQATDVRFVDDAFLEVHSTRVADSNNEILNSIEFSFGKPLESGHDIVLRAMARFSDESASSESDDTGELVQLTWNADSSELSVSETKTDATLEFRPQNFLYDDTPTLFSESSSAWDPGLEAYSSLRSAERVENPEFESLYRKEQAAEKYAERFDLVRKSLTLQELQDVKNELIANGQEVDQELLDTIETLERQINNALEFVESLDKEFDLAFRATFHTFQPPRTRDDVGGIASFSNLEARLEGSRLDLEDYEKYVEEKQIEQRESEKQNNLDIVSIADATGHLEGGGVLSNHEARAVLDKAREALESKP